MNFHAFSRWRHGFLAGLILLGFTASGAPQTGSKHVLILHSFGQNSSPSHAVASAFQSTLAREFGSLVDMELISLGADRDASREADSVMVEFLRQRCLAARPDLIVSVAAPAAKFVIKHRERAFPGVPVIFAAADARIAGPQPRGGNATAVYQRIDTVGAVKDILQMAPDTTSIVFVLGSSALERSWVDIYRRELQEFNGRVTLTFLNDLSLDQMEQRVSSLPPHTFISFVLLIRDDAGIVYDGYEPLQRLHAVANAPLYGLFQSQMGRGIIGGSLYQDQLVGIETARSAARILRGEPADSVSPKVLSPSTAVYDWRELHRWGIPETRLPAGRSILFREPTLWERYRWYIVGIISICLFEMLLIAGLITNLLVRRRVERALRQSEERSRLAAKAAEFGAYSYDFRTGRFFFSPEHLSLYGLPDGASLKLDDDLVPEAVHIEDRASFLTHARASSDPSGSGTLDNQYRIIRTDGQVRWLRVQGKTSFSDDGRPLRSDGIVQDITERKRAEDALRAAEAEARATFEHAAVGIAHVGTDGRCLRVNDKLCSVLGYSREEMLQLSFQDITYPDDLEADLNNRRRILSGEINAYTMEKRYFRKDRSLVWGNLSVSLVRTAAGEPLFFISVVRDITDRKRAEEALHDLGGRLINAQEKERARLAKELHDGLSQNLALMAVELEMLGQEPPTVPFQLDARLQDISATVRALSVEVRDISHGLHPAILTQLGLAVALKSFCRELGAKHKIEIGFKALNLPHELSEDVALSLYRVAQEALQNALKHGSARKVAVELTAAGTTIDLIVSDDGKGFDVKVGLASGSLGLVSMRERVRLVHGEMTVESKQGQGTRIHVRVPLPQGTTEAGSQS